MSSCSHFLFACSLLVIGCNADRTGGNGTPDAGVFVSGCGSEPDQMGCDCQQPGQMRACYAGPLETRHMGLCQDGMQACVERVQTTLETFGAPGAWGPCQGGVLPATMEQCSDGLDHDCNGAAGCSDSGCSTDPMCQMVCQPGELKPCYTGPSNTSGVGACHAGKQVCNAQGHWDPACSGEVLPDGNELFKCHDGIDNDCNGATDCQELFCLLDPGCSPQICTAGAMQACYTGPAGTNGVAACHGGMQTCAADGKSWGTCTGQVLPGSEAGHCSDTLDNDCNGLLDCADPTCASAVACCVPGAGSTVDGTIYVHSPTDLYVVNPSGWTVTKIGSFATGEQITDLAVTPDDKLYAVSFSSLYSVNKSTGKATLVAGISGSGNNSLTFLPSGNLLAADSAGSLKRITPASGAVTGIGDFGQSLSSSGDLVAIGNGILYGVSTTTAGGGDASANNLLIRVDPTSAVATVVGPIGYGSVWGLAYVNAKVIGFTTAGQILQIDPQTGVGTLLASRGVAFWGAAMSPLVPPVTCP